MPPTSERPSSVASAIATRHAAMPSAMISKVTDDFAESNFAFCCFWSRLTFC